MRCLIPLLDLLQQDSQASLEYREDHEPCVWISLVCGGHRTGQAAARVAVHHPCSALPGPRRHESISPMQCNLWYLKMYAFYKLPSAVNSSSKFLVL